MADRDEAGTLRRETCHSYRWSGAGHGEQGREHALAMERSPPGGSMILSQAYLVSLDLIRPERWLTAIWLSEKAILRRLY